MLMNTYINRNKDIFRVGSRVYHRLFGEGSIISKQWKDSNYSWEVLFDRKILDDETNNNFQVKALIFESQLYPARGKCFKCNTKHVVSENKCRITANKRKVICKECIKSEEDLLV